MIAEAQTDPELRSALDERWLAPRREIAAGLLREAVERGEIAADTEVAAAVDQLFAPLCHRLLLGHEPLDDGLPATLVRQLLRGLRAD